MPSGWSCQACQTALSAPRAKTTRPPGSLRATSGPLVAPPGGAPTDAHPDQLPLRDTCQRCQMALSVPRTKTTRRPPVCRTAPGSLVAIPASDENHERDGYHPGT